MYLVAVLLKRYSLMAMGFVRNTLGQLTASYVPSPVEMFLALGILSFGLLFITVGDEGPSDGDARGRGRRRPSAAPRNRPATAVEAEVTSL